MPGTVKSIKIACLDGESDRVSVCHSGLEDGHFREIEDEESLNESTRYEQVEKVNIQEGVEIISTGCFDGCPNINSVSIPRTINLIGTGAFRGCSSLEKIELNEGVKYIGSSAFAYSGIKEILIPESVKYLGEHAFEECRQLEVVKFKSKNIEVIETALFLCCSKLKAIYIPKGFDTDWLNSTCIECNVDPEIIVY